MPSPLLAGIDVGGTSTRIALADATGRVLGQARAPGAGLTEVSPQVSAGRLAAAWREACSQANHPPSEPVAALFAGFGSLAATRDEAATRRILKAAGIRARRFAVGHDTDNAQAGALPSGAGVHVIAGTGSVVVARDKTGRLHRVGGWGPGIGDEGSSWWIANAALRDLTARADTAKKPTSLDLALLLALRIHEPRELLAAVFGQAIDRAAFAALAQPVLAHAASGDRDARRLLLTGARSLGLQVVQAVRLARLTTPTLTVSGGMFDYAPAYARQVASAARRAGLDVRLAPAVASPLVGSLLLARRLTAAVSTADLPFARLAAKTLTAA